VEAALDAVHEGGLAFTADPVKIGAAANHLVREPFGVDLEQVALDPIDLVD
jgi:hypothetical protein